MSAPPFVDPESQELDLGQIAREAVPLAALVVLFGGAALLFALFGMAVFSASILRVVLFVAAQFVLVVGTGIVLIYVVARGIQLADPSSRPVSGDSENRDTGNWDAESPDPRS
ncbi:hypothetical protein [Halococcoides cellulosivorans]|uniref:hypothetical protein n=1 Tax=Halococcoides cellulosivorans TaxID=1679096 RepID=UPI001F240E68|nr:hypothetical protein [Halococcoides cellulosivorans]